MVEVVRDLFLERGRGALLAYRVPLLRKQRA
jgi:hypothetical protein